MKEFLLIFRLNTASNVKPSPEQIQERMNWLAGITAQNKLADKGNTLSTLNARTVKVGLHSIGYVGNDTGEALNDFYPGYAEIMTKFGRNAVGHR